MDRLRLASVKGDADTALPLVNCEIAQSLGLRKTSIPKLLGSAFPYSCVKSHRANFFPGTMAGSNPHPLQAARTAPDYCTGSMRVCQGARLYTSLCVCIVGGGSIATAAAGWLTREGKNLCVHVLTRQPEKWNKNLLVKANPTCRWGSMEPFRASIHL